MTGEFAAAPIRRTATSADPDSAGHLHDDAVLCGVFGHCGEYSWSKPSPTFLPHLLMQCAGLLLAV
jgi:hypothetical protein